MNLTDSNENNLQQRIASNLQYYRKLAGYTQSALAERINYSDKSVSKWERAGGYPDIYVLVMLAELYGVTVNDLISESKPLLPPDPGFREKSRYVMCFQYIVLVWLVATAAFTVLMVFFSGAPYAWYVFVLALPLSSAVSIVFAMLWWGRLARFLTISAMAWSLAVCVYLMLMTFSFAYLFFIVCGVTQLLVLLWYVRGWLADKARRL
ncbi:MAG: helix-turn-helix domain-containing protein [Oscillospiraceae bacterium]|jgi:transcriptional regulator with XRE-family HTH domain|nr:helix-turn-helix domain-containing protein [Oscillospiraceae bacterium]